MYCPRCSNPLTDVVYEGAAIHTCQHCGGEFVDGDALRHIARTRETHFSADVRKQWQDVQPQFGTPVSESEPQPSCPACGGTMGLVNYCGDSGVFIDTCEDCHGVWLDHDELEKIQVLMERWEDEAPAQLREIAGKLEDARRTAAESTDRAFAGSRFAYVNALINRFLDAA